VNSKPEPYIEALLRRGEAGNEEEKIKENNNGGQAIFM
jgi:hypothetical protein